MSCVPRLNADGDCFVIFGRQLSLKCYSSQKALFRGFFFFFGTRNIVAPSVGLCKFGRDDVSIYFRKQLKDGDNPPPVLSLVLPH